MKTTRREILAATAGMALAAAAGPATAQKKYDTGASDKEVRIGSTQPLSGPASPYAGIGKAMVAYFKMINDQGGINGRKISFFLYDDGYQPPQTVDNTRKLVEQDEVLFTLGSLGSPTQLAVQRYMNQRKVPQLFVSAPASKLADAKNFPYTINFAPVYEMEGAVYAKHIVQTKPQGRIAILYQDDDAGRALFKGLKDGLVAGGAASRIAIEQTYTSTDPTIESQVISMKGSGADVVVLITLPRMTAIALRKMASMDWKPTTYVGNAGSSVRLAIEPAGPGAGNGVITSDYRKRVDDPRWADDPGVKGYLAFREKYLPGVALSDETYSVGYDIAAAGAEIIRMAGDDLTHANILRIMQSLKNFGGPLTLPGLGMTTTPTDYLGYKALQLMRFDGKAYVPLGGVVGAH